MWPKREHQKANVAPFVDKSKIECIWPKREHWKAEVTPFVDKSTIQYIWLEREHWKVQEQNQARMAKARALESPSEASHRQEKIKHKWLQGEP